MRRGPLEKLGLIRVKVNASAERKLSEIHDFFGRRCYCWLCGKHDGGCQSKSNIIHRNRIDCRDWQRVKESSINDMMKTVFVATTLLASSVAGFVPNHRAQPSSSVSLLQAEAADRRAFISSVVTTTGAVVTGAFTDAPPAQAVGPVKIALEPIKYKAAPCPPDKPIPGEKAMFGMRGLCVNVEANLKEGSPKDLEKVGVYGFVTDGLTGDSVLANNPDKRYAKMIL